MKIWKKFYECECGAEGIMMSKDSFDDVVYLAIFRNSFYKDYNMSLKGKLRVIWDIIKYGSVWNDNIILNKKEAKKFGLDLIKFSESKYKGK